jgi:hypothetical protein
MDEWYGTTADRLDPIHETGLSREA